MKPFNLPGKLRPGLTFESDSNDEMDTETSKADERQEINELLPKVQSASIMKSAEELREEGCLLASNGDFALALKVFNGAAFHYKNDGFLHELLSQTHLQLGNHWQAVYSAERAVTCLGFVDWHEGYITLGRAQREVGEVLLAVQSYEKALESPAIRADEASQEEYAELLGLRSKLLDTRNAMSVGMCGTCGTIESAGAWKEKQGKHEKHEKQEMQIMQEMETGTGAEDKAQVNECFANLSLRGSGPIFGMPPPPT